MKKITIAAEIRIPAVPNFLLMDDGQKIPVSAVTEDDLRKIGEAWIDALIANAQRQLKEEMTTLPSYSIL